MKDNYFIIDEAYENKHEIIEFFKGHFLQLKFLAIKKDHYFNLD